MRQKIWDFGLRIGDFKKDYDLIYIGIKKIEGGGREAKGQRCRV